MHTVTELESFSLSDRGRRRNNEDFAAFYEPTDPAERAEKGCLYIVADGVGGAARGERASEFAAQKVLYEYYQQPVGADPSERLRQIIQKVNEDIHSYAELKAIRMATTIVAVVIRNGILHLANVGDSRAYLIRSDQCKQLNRDHSIVGEMVASGEMTEAAAMASKVKNRLTRSLGGEPKVHVDIYPPLALSPGDKVLLCSDGLTRYAAREDVYKLTAQGSLAEIGQRLIQFANARGGADNVSVVLVCYEGAAALGRAQLVSQPVDIDLDTVPTQPDVPVANSARRWLRARLVVPSILILLMLSVAGFNVAANWKAWKASLLGPVGVPTTTAPPASAVPKASPSIQPAVPIVMPSNTPVASPAPAPTATATVPVAAPMQNDVCVRQVKDRPPLSTLIGALVATGGRYRSGQSYSRCQLDDVQDRCDQLIHIENNSYVVDGWWIVVPDVSQSTCVSKSGKWVPVGPQK